MTSIVVVGDALLDRDLTGHVERVCPDAPVPVVDVQAVHVRPGGAGLAALLLAADGCEVTLVTALGRRGVPRRGQHRRAQAERTGVTRPRSRRRTARPVRRGPSGGAR